MPVGQPLERTRSSHLNHVLSCSLGSTTKLVTWMHVLSCSLASIDEEWFPEFQLSYRGSQTTGNAFPGCMAVEFCSPSSLNVASS